MKMQTSFKRWRGCLFLLYGLGLGMLLAGAVKTQAQLETAEERFWEHVGTASDPPIAALLELIQQRYDPYFQTAAQRVHEGRYREALALYSQIEARAGSQKEFLEWAKGIPDVIAEEVASCVAEFPTSSEALRLARQQNQRESIICALSIIHKQLLAEYGLACQGEVHVLMEEGKYAEAIRKAEQLDAALSQRSQWRCEIGGKIYTKQSGTSKLNLGDMYSPSGSLYYKPTGVTYWYCLDLAICYYHLREYEQVREYLLKYPATFDLSGSCLSYYGKRLREDFKQVGYQELGGILYLAQSSNVLGEYFDCPLRTVPDPRYTANYEEALKDAAEAYKLMPNNLDVCLQYYVLLCTLKRYQQAIELYRHMYALVIKGPSAYVTAQGQITTLPAYLVPHEEWEAWKRAHGGRDAYPIPTVDSSYHGR